MFILCIYIYEHFASFQISYLEVFSVIQRVLEQIFSRVDLVDLFQMCKVNIFGPILQMDIIRQMFTPGLKSNDPSIL